MEFFATPSLRNVFYFPFLCQASHLKLTGRQRCANPPFCCITQKWNAWSASRKIERRPFYPIIELDRRSGQVNQVFHSFENGELVPVPFGKDKALTYLAARYRTSLYRPYTLSICIHVSRMSKMSGASRKRLISSFLHPFHIYTHNDPIPSLRTRTPKGELCSTEEGQECPISARSLTRNSGHRMQEQ